MATGGDDELAAMLAEYGGLDTPPSGNAGPNNALVAVASNQIAAGRTEQEVRGGTIGTVVESGMATAQDASELLRHLDDGDLSA